MPSPEVNKLLDDTDQHMQQTIDALKREYSLIRTGRANPAIFDRVMVEYYGEHVPIKQVGTIAAPEPRLLTITPWDKSMIKKITDAITSSELGLNPVSDGSMIRVPLPPLTTERRKELVKIVARKGEEARIATRNIRRDGVEKLRSMQKAGNISEDELHRYQDQVQKLTDTHTEQIGAVEKAKEKEVMEA